MQKIKQYFFLLLLIPSLSFAQNSDEELIDWNPSRQLVWSDYKGSPNPNTDAAAATTTYLGIEYNMNEKGFTYKIQCRFSKTRSWGRSQTVDILKHEQGHFDIAEIFARRLNKKMSEYQFSEATYRKDLKSIYESITTEKEDFQNQYDRDTDHSRKKELQMDWLKKIEKLLEELKDYSVY